jgi:hypothetical protein
MLARSGWWICFRSQDQQTRRRGFINGIIRAKMIELLHVECKFWALMGRSKLFS